MISQDMRNLVRAFEGLATSGCRVTMTAEQFALIAEGLGIMADAVEALEAHVVPATARYVAAGRQGNVVPFSKPWGGHPPGSDRPDGGGSAA